MDKLNVGVVVDDLPDEKVGGGFSYVAALTEAIDDYNFDPALQFSFVSLQSHTGTSFRNKPFIRLKPNEKLSRSIRLQHAVNGRLLKKLVQCKLPAKSLADYLEAKYNRAYNKIAEQQLVYHHIDLLYYLQPTYRVLSYPFVCTNWDVGHLSMPSFPEVAMNGQFEGRTKYYKDVVAKAFAIMCESEAGKDELIRYMGINKDRVYVAPLFPGKVVQLHVALEDDDCFLKMFGLINKSYFFYPAQFWAHKNHYNLLLAFGMLMKEMPDLKLVFTGSDKGNLSYIENVISRFGLSKNVVIAGFVTPAELNCLYRHAVALVMPSFLGPTNMPLLEAQALGCPIICSDLSGHREMLGNEATYIRPDDPHTIFQAMRHEISKRDRCTAKTNPVFNIQNTVRQIEEAFLKIKVRRKTFGLNFAPAYVH